LRTFNKQDIVFIPFFTSVQDKRVNLVELNIKELKVDLYDREREIDLNSDLSEIVVEMIKISYRL
jgi:hypothetical protein